MTTINRSVLLVRPQAPCIKWVQSVLPHIPGSEDVRLWATRVFLVAEDPKGRAESAPLRRYFAEIFEGELSSWTEDPSRWPVRRDMKLFLEWFDVEATSLVVDLLDDVIEHDDIDPGD